MPRHRLSIPNTKFFFSKNIFSIFPFCRRMSKCVIQKTFLPKEQEFPTVNFAEFSFWIFTKKQNLVNENNFSFLFSIRFFSFWYKANSVENKRYFLAKNRYLFGKKFVYEIFENKNAKMKFVMKIGLIQKKEILVITIRFNPLILMLPMWFLLS